MTRTCFVCLFLCLATTFLLSQSNPVPPGSTAKADPKTQVRILDQCGKLPLGFEANHGQTDAQVKFLSRTSEYTLFLTGNEAVLTLSGHKAETKAAHAQKHQKPMPAPKAGGVLRMKLRNANPATRVTGVDELAGTSNYFIGNDPAKWRTNVPTYAKVKYEGIYSGIDLVYYGNQRQLEYDFIVAPGANPNRIAFDVRGAKRIRRTEHGELVFKVGEDEIRWHKPVVYQEKDGTRREIAAHYAITDTNSIAFEVAKYDASRPLYIDPLIYSTYLGGSGQDAGYGIAVDNLGNAYVTGYTSSSNFPVTSGAFQTTCCGAFVTKLNPTGTALVYSTYLDNGWGRGIAVDATGNAYVTGNAGGGFPVTPGAFQTVCGGTCEYGNAFVTKLNPTGSVLVYSTYLGGSGVYGDLGTGIAVDNSGNAYVTGQTSSTNFPVTPDAFQTTFGDGSTDAFVTKFNPQGSALVYSTYLGGSGNDYNPNIAVDSSGNAYVTGTTQSTDFPVTPGAFQTTCGSARHCENAFVTKLNPTGSALVYSTYLGGSGDTGNGIAVDSSGNAYVTGQTGRRFPVTRGAIQKIGNLAAFVTKLNPTGMALVYSTLLGGSDSDSCWQTWGQSIAVDSFDNAYVTGATCSNDFQTTPGAFQTTCGGDSCADPNGDAFVAQLDMIQMLATTTTSLKSSPNPSTYGQKVTFTAMVTSSGGTPPDGETVSFIKGTTVLGTGALSGGSATFNTSTLPVGKTSVTAVYGGDSDFKSSKSKPVKQVVEKADYGDL